MIWKEHWSKKILPFYNNDMVYSISDFVIDKNINDIPDGGKLTNRYLKHKNIAYILSFLFISVFMIVGLILYIVAIPVLVLVSDHMFYLISAIAGIFLAVGIVCWGINLLAAMKWAQNTIKKLNTYLKKLIIENKLISDINKYPYNVIMSFYIDQPFKYKIDYPNKYPGFHPLMCLCGLSHFLDRLYEYVNKPNDYIQKIEPKNC